MSWKIIAGSVGTLVATIVAIVFIVLYAQKGDGGARETCGGVLEGDSGTFKYSGNSGHLNSCLWILRSSGNGIRFTVTELTNEVALYTGHYDGSSNMNPTVWTSAVVGTTLEKSGNTFVIISPNDSATVSFAWQSIYQTGKDLANTTVTYMDTPEGLIEWRGEAERQDALFVLNIHWEKTLAWQLTVQEACASSGGQCGCVQFGVYQVTSQGRLREMTRTCDGPTSAVDNRVGDKLVAFLRLNSTAYKNISLRISWSVDSPAVPSTTARTTTSSTSTSTPAGATTGRPTSGSTEGTQAPTTSVLVPRSSTTDGYIVSTGGSTTTHASSSVNPGEITTGSAAVTTDSAYNETTVTVTSKTTTPEFSELTPSSMNTEMTSATWSTTTIPDTSDLPELGGTLAIATKSDGLYLLSLASLEVMKLEDDSGTDVLAVAYDSTLDNIYWIERTNEETSQIYQLMRSNIEEIRVERLRGFSSIVRALAFDWTTGNLYIGGGSGIQVCNSTNPEQQCAQLALKGEPYGLALHPDRGLLYWTNRRGKQIHRIGMDGSSTEVIWSSSGNPVGVTINFESDRLYWTNSQGFIETSDLDGKDQKILPASNGTIGHNGIDVLEGVLYWSNADSKTVYRCNSSECDDQEIVYTAESFLQDLAIIDPSSQPWPKRRNDCAECNCSHNCVLSRASFRCLCPHGLQLDNDGRTCVQAH